MILGTVNGEPSGSYLTIRPVTIEGKGAATLLTAYLLLDLMTFTDGGTIVFPNLPFKGIMNEIDIDPNRLMNSSMFKKNTRGSYDLNIGVKATNSSSSAQITMLFPDKI